LGDETSATRAGTLDFIKFLQETKGFSRGDGGGDEKRVNFFDFRNFLRI